MKYPPTLPPLSHVFPCLFSPRHGHYPPHFPSSPPPPPPMVCWHACLKRLHMLILLAAIFRVLVLAGGQAFLPGVERRQADSVGGENGMAWRISPPARRRPPWRITPCRQPGRAWTLDEWMDGPRPMRLLSNTRMVCYQHVAHWQALPARWREFARHVRWRTTTTPLQWDSKRTTIRTERRASRRGRTFPCCINSWAYLPRFCAGVSSRRSIDLPLAQRVARLLLPTSILVYTQREERGPTCPAACLLLTTLSAHSSWLSDDMITPYILTLSALAVAPHLSWVACGRLIPCSFFSMAFTMRAFPL